MIGSKFFGVSKQASGIVAGATVNLDAGNASSYSGSGTTWFDLTANNYDATLVNGVGYDSGFGGALVFDGLDDYVSGNSTYSVRTTIPFTLEIIFNIDVRDSNFDGLTSIKSFNTTYPYLVYVSSVDTLPSYGTITFGSPYLTPTNQYIKLFITPIVNASTWYHLVITYNGLGSATSGNFNAYFNSVLQTYKGLNPGFAALTNISSIGGAGGNNYNFDGKIPVFNLYYNKEFTQEEVTQNYNFYKSRYSFIIDTTDANANAFITAAGITDSTQKSAIETLVLAFKGYGIWDKMKAIYPFVGGTADTHKYNLKDPRDLDAAYRLTFSGSFTHDSNGVLPNNSYANTHITPNTQLLTRNTHVSVYPNLSPSNVGYELGCIDGGNRKILLAVNNSGNLNMTFYGPTRGIIGGPYGLSVHWMATVSGTTYQAGFRRGNRWLYTNNLNDSFPPNTQLYLFAVNNNGTPDNYSDKRLAFSTIGDHLDETEGANLYTAIQAFQTTLGRQI